MRPTPLITIAALALALLMGCSRPGSSADPFRHQPKNAVYHWRTTYDPDSSELRFMARHHVGRLYVHYFDIVTRDGQIVPEATVRFACRPCDTLEVVPTIYITIDAIRRLARRVDSADDLLPETTDLATRIVRRVNAMNKHNRIARVSEVQIDCDWTAATREAYFRLLEALRALLHAQHMALSVTIRLHQLASPSPPADMGVLMLYNTGNLMSEHTHNSIIDVDDVKPYFKSGTHYNLPLDFAYPVFGWQVCYRDGKLVRLASPQSPVPEGCTVRREQADYATISQVKQLAESCLEQGGDHSVVIYHLDQQFLNQFTDEQMDHIYGDR